MFKSLQFVLLVLSLTLSSTVAQGQPNKLAYTVTDSIQNGVKWNFLRTVDLRNGSFSPVLLRLLSNSDTVANSILCNGVAAIAVDDKNRRLYYTPMLIDRLSYVDLRTMTKHVITNNFTGLIPKAADQSNIITRMVIGTNDYGYALTNDGKHLIRFNTMNNQITDLGSLINDPLNNGVSVHEICSSFGGDIVASDDKFLYLITARNNVFKINLQNNMATYRGAITGLPPTFATSGLSVDYDRKNLVVTSSTDASDIYSVDIQTLFATAVNSGSTWLSADLASSNRLKQQHDNSNKFLALTDDIQVPKIQLYPNPVTTNEFKIQFSNISAGAFTVSVIDAVGHVVLINKISVGVKNNVIAIKLPSSLANGVYVVKISDKNNSSIFTEKLNVQ